MMEKDDECDDLGFFFLFLKLTFFDNLGGYYNITGLCVMSISYYLTVLVIAASRFRGGQVVLPSFMYKSRFALG